MANGTPQRRATSSHDQLPVDVKVAQAARPYTRSGVGRSAKVRAASGARAPDAARAIPAPQGPTAVRRTPRLDRTSAGGRPGAYRSVQFGMPTSKGAAHLHTRIRELARGIKDKRSVKAINEESKQSADQDLIPHQKDAGSKDSSVLRQPSSKDTRNGKNSPVESRPRQDSAGSTGNETEGPYQVFWEDEELEDLSDRKPSPRISQAEAKQGPADGHGVGWKQPGPPAAPAPPNRDAYHRAVAGLKASRNDRDASVFKDDVRPSLAHAAVGSPLQRGSGHVRAFAPGLTAEAAEPSQMTPSPHTIQEEEEIHNPPGDSSLSPSPAPPLAEDDPSGSPPHRCTQVALRNLSAPSRLRLSASDNSPTTPSTRDPKASPDSGNLGGGQNAVNSPPPLMTGHEASTSKDRPSCRDLEKHSQAPSTGDPEPLSNGDSSADLLLLDRFTKTTGGHISPPGPSVTGHPATPRGDPHAEPPLRGRFPVTSIIRERSASPDGDCSHHGQPSPRRPSDTRPEITRPPTALLRPRTCPNAVSLLTTPHHPRDRSSSLFNVSSAYRARRSSILAHGLASPRDPNWIETSSIASSISSLASSRTSSVAQIFRRSRQSRFRRLSLFVQAYDRGKERAIEKLRRVFKTVKIITGICLALKSYVKTTETKQWSLIEMHLNLRADMEKTLAFDPTMFSKLRVTRGSEKLRSILSAKPDDRSRYDIEVVVALLRKNKTFADYDRETQKSLARVMEYLRYEPRRIILKEGHQASGFYIILSGTCLVNQKDIDPRNNETFVRTVDEIHSGDSFGSLELLNDCTRMVSIVCRDECEVLLVNKEDFDVLIKQPFEEEREKLLAYCTAQNVFENPPTSFDFRQDHHAVSAKKFKPGVVITNDISESDFIFVVRSGKCRVISEVKEIKGKPSPRRKPSSLRKYSDDIALKRTQPPKDWRRLPSEPFEIKRQKTFPSLTRKPKSMDVDGMDHTNMPPVLPKSLFEGSERSSYDGEDSFDESGSDTTWQRVAMTSKTGAEREKRRSPPPSRLRSTYAEVAHLREGDVFGVETLVTSSQSDSRLSLVSEGADCIIISKKFFATQATVATIQQSTRKAIEYPSASYTLDRIHQARAWSTYKEAVVKDVCNRKMLKVSESSR